jgi:hypothetical protein
MGPTRSAGTTVCNVTISLTPGTELGLMVTTGMLDAISRQPVSLKGNSHCPTLECSLENYTTLAVCAFCESEEVAFGKDSKQCTYDIQEGYPPADHFGQYGKPETLTNQSILGPIHSYSDFVKAVYELDDSSVLVRSCSVDVWGYSHANLTFKVVPIPLMNSSAFQVLRTHPNSTRESWDLERTISLSWNTEPDIRTIGVEMIKWDLGTERGLNHTYTPLSHQKAPKGISSVCTLDRAPYSMKNGSFNIARSTCFTSSSNITAMERLNRFGEINGTITRCRPTLCARQYHNVTINPTGVRAENTTDFPFITSSWYRGAPVTAYDKFNNKFLFADGAYFLPDIFERVTSSDSFKYLLKSYLPKTGHDWENLFERMSDVMTQGLQSPLNPNATRLYGPAYGSETFIRVRWPWFIMPLCLVAAANVFIAMTIYRSRQSPYLFKNSVMAVLFHGLQDSEKQEILLASVSKKQTHEGLTTELSTLRVSFRKDKNGVLRLEKEL